MRRDTWKIVSRNSFADNNVLPGTWSLKCKRKPDLDNQEIQCKILCKTGYPEEIVSLTPELILSSGPMGHSEVDVVFEVHSRFAESKY